jgi:maltooligosyltrehalose trehalohydrolase
LSLHRSHEFPKRLIREHHMPFGCELQEPSGVSFRVFAPGADTMRLKLGGASAPLQMNSTGNGWHQLSVSDAGPGTSYFLVLPDGTRVPDPASRYQPDDVYGPSEVIDPKA